MVICIYISYLPVMNFSFLFFIFSPSFLKHLHKGGRGVSPFRDARRPKGKIERAAPLSGSGDPLPGCRVDLNCQILPPPTFFFLFSTFPPLNQCVDSSTTTDDNGIHVSIPNQQFCVFRSFRSRDSVQ